MWMSEMEWDAGVEPNWSRVRADWVVLVQKQSAHVDPCGELSDKGQK